MTIGNRNSRWIPPEEEALQRAIERLERALESDSGRDNSAGALRLQGVLGELSLTLTQHMAAMDREDALLADDDLSGPMLTTLSRRLHKIRQMVRILRARNVEVLEFAERVARHETANRRNGDPPDKDITTDRYRLWEESSALVADLRRLVEHKIELIWEDIATDVGVGD
jgi:hypothetical protein